MISEVVSDHVDRNGLSNYDHLAESGSSGNASSESSVYTKLKGDGCAARCCRCLSNVPCSSMMSWVMLLVATSGCGGALMIGTQRTRTMLNNPSLLVHSEPVCLGVIFGMVFVASIFLVLATISSRPLSVSIFSTDRQNDCAKALQIIIILIQLLLLVGWTAVTCVLSVPVSFLSLVFYMYYRGDNCINLQHYGITNESADICGSAFKSFTKQADGAFECYVIALVAAVLVILSLVFWLMCTTANFAYLRESGPTEYSVYQNEAAQSKAGVYADTRM